VRGGQGVERALLAGARAVGGDQAADGLVLGLVSEVQDFPWGRFVFFADPDGNRWAVQQITQPS
jgi:predicted enzyme related to lactoylglutathione lyase